MYYSWYKDGTSYNTLHRKLSKKGEFIILVFDTDKNIFGGLFTHNFEFSTNFFGTGESFLFKLK